MNGARKNDIPVRRVASLYHVVCGPPYGIPWNFSENTLRSSSAPRTAKIKMIDTCRKII